MALRIAAFLQGLGLAPKPAVAPVRTRRTHAFVPVGLFAIDDLDAISNHARLILLGACDLPPLTLLLDILFRVGACAADGRAFRDPLVIGYGQWGDDDQAQGEVEGAGFHDVLQRRGWCCCVRRYL